MSSPHWDTHTSTPLSCQLIDHQLTFLHPWPACTHQLTQLPVHPSTLHRMEDCVNWPNWQNWVNTSIYSLFWYIIYTKLSKYKYLLIILIYNIYTFLHPAQDGGMSNIDQYRSVPQHVPQWGTLKYVPQFNLIKFPNVSNFFGAHFLLHIHISL